MRRRKGRLRGIRVEWFLTGRHFLNGNEIHRVRNKMMDEYTSNIYMAATDYLLDFCEEDVAHEPPEPVIKEPHVWAPLRAHVQNDIPDSAQFIDAKAVIK